MYDLQKANMWKRISAALLDVILLFLVAVTLAWAISSIADYDSYSAELQACYDRYESEFGVDLEISSEDYAALSQEEQAKYDDVVEAISKDEEAYYLYNMIINLTLISVIFSILISYLLFEFLVPLLLGNGQTIGKKVFSLGVMRLDGVKLTPVLLFARTVLGKCAVCTLLPIMAFIMIYFGFMGVIGTVVILGIVLMQIVLTFATRAHTPIHDILAHTVVIDLASQMIFDTPEDLIKYKQRVHAELVSQDDSY